MTDNALNIINSGLPIFDDVAGSFSAIQLTTKGDLLVHNGANYIRLSVGINNKALTAASGETSGFSWDNLSFSGNMILIEKYTANNSATIDFTSLNLATYATFFFNLRSVHPATDSVTLRCLFSTNSGVSFLSTGYKYIYRTIDSTGPSGSRGYDSTANYIQTTNSIGNAGGEGVAGWFWYLPSNNPNTQMRNSIEWQLYLQNPSSRLFGIWGGGFNSTVATINAIRFQFSSGNIESGDFYLYGVESS